MSAAVAQTPKGVRIGRKRDATRKARARRPGPSKSNEASAAYCFCLPYLTPQPYALVSGVLTVSPARTCVRALST